MLTPISLGGNFKPISNEVARVEIAAIILAAGESSRLQGKNKLLLPVKGTPMISVVTRTAREAGCNPVIVVTGNDQQKVYDALKDHSVLLAYNPDPADGLAGSLVAGIGALPETVDGAVIMLADMPLVTAGTLDALRDAWLHAGGDKIVYPAKDGKQGNPVLFPRRYFNTLRNLKGDAGGKGLLNSFESETVAVAIESDEIFFDVDTEEDYKQLVEQLKR